MSVLDPLFAELSTNRLSLTAIHIRILQLSWRCTKERTREVQIQLENQKRIASDQIKALKSACDRVIRDTRQLTPEGKASVFRELCIELENRLSKEGNYPETPNKRGSPETEPLVWQDHSFELARLSPNASMSFEVDDFLTLNNIMVSGRVRTLLRQKIPAIFAESRELNFSWKTHPSDLAVRAMIRLVAQVKVEEYSQDIRKIQLLRSAFEREKARQNLGLLALNSAFQLNGSVNLLQFPFRNGVIILFLTLVLVLQLVSLRGVVPTVRKLYTFLQFAERGRFVIVVDSPEPPAALPHLRRHLRRVRPAPVHVAAKGRRPDRLPPRQQLLPYQHRPLQNHSARQQQTSLRLRHRGMSPGLLRVS